jgi:hypothetical protein
MKTHASPTKTRPSRRWLWLFASGALLLHGCISSTEVKSIVRDSNYQMLLASTPGLETGLATNPAEGPNAAAAADDAAAVRINAFLEAHQDDPSMANALRLRQTLLYLNQRAFALADSAILQIDARKLSSPRDQALVAAYPDLRWWAEYAHTAELTFATTQQEAALAHSASLEQHAAKLAASPDLRDYLLEMRAWIGLKLGLATVNNPAFTQATIQNAINPWAETFSPAELTLLGAADFKNAKPFDLATRRVLRARGLLTKLAQQFAGAPHPTLTFNRPAFQQYYDSLPP